MKCPDVCIGGLKMDPLILIDTKKEVDSRMKIGGKMLLPI